ncbi:MULTISPECIES: ABC transporter ATP-binding protein [Paenibacillus]|uniref:Urea ABC transporter ATP-binding protein n=1 Tax=Paenibacillus naphthalenovorans TaxID=162209 RepID=A0A0U2UQM4_9BACL|nr:MULTISPECIES: ABC transporter ATP-binding protein [Paenibacillus]ALS24321.1 urea ABC transporter ATP-binding protein [Paenibacillus naphthalenovorans]NTZ20423.1 ABC transporter ATP-binding protein [Paenibacillus sp. JMULE4]GCL73787.1 ABC transporter ATP-binding protein [Paenibacillus naphthalenovorans]
MGNLRSEISPVLEPPRKETLLELRNVVKQFGGLKAVDGVNMSVRRGELRCLIGPNGAGKSTVFKLIMGIYPPTQGHILFKGNDITKYDTWKRARMGISIKMQVPGVYGELSLRDNMRIATQNFVEPGDVEAEIDRLLSFVGIEQLGNPQVSNLSHGQQQWLEIAMALASKPDILLLDEPAAGMGPEETEFTAQLVKKMNESGITILFIDHDMEFVRRIAENVTVLHYGKPFAEGTLSEIEANEEVVRIYLGKV